MARELIDRYALIKDMYEDGYFPLTVADKATEKVMAQPTVDRWIPCSERLPEEEGMYLITSNLFGSLEVQYVFYSENVQMFVCNGTPVVWMPLPEPYKAGDIDG